VHLFYYINNYKKNIYKCKYNIFNNNLILNRYLDSNTLSGECPSELGNLTELRLL